MKASKEKLYIAYGSNLSIEQMRRRCPTAKVVGKSILRNWRLRFRGGDNQAVATIERCKGYKVPVLVWKIQPRDEAALDRYEGYPYHYRKENLRITLNGKRVGAMVYIINEGGRPYNAPSEGYYDIIRRSYENLGFDLDILNEAAKSAKPSGQPDEVVIKQIMAIRTSGETNMLDTRMVQIIANREGFYELVIYLEEHRKDYVNFILTGKSE